MEKILQILISRNDLELYIPLYIYYLLQKQAQQHGSMAIPQQPQLSKPDTASADIPLELATSGEM